MSRDELIISGARQNNLKDVTLRLPHDRVIAVTGVSGSGKSSLAFDTIFAEGQWRFIESLSTYARLFLEKLDRPEVESIENIRPAIALEQRNPVRGSRSTVGTLTELFEYFRLIYAKVARPHCPSCGREVRRWDPSAVTAELLEHHAGAKAVVIFESPDDAAGMRKKGFLRVWDGEGVRDLEEYDGARPYHVVVDRVVVRDEPRLAEAVETAFEEGGGRIHVVIMGGPDLRFASALVCDACGQEVPEPAPILFSFNHPVGACPECKGFGNVLRYAEELIVPDPYLSLEEGAVDPWQKPAARWWKRQMIAGAPKAGMDLHVPYRELPDEHRKLLFRGCEHFYGIDDFFEELEGKRYKLHVRVFLSRYRKAVTCGSCGGRRLNSGALAYKLGGLNIMELTALPVGDLVSFFRDLALSPFEQDVVREPLRQVECKLGFLGRVGLDYLSPARETRSLSGGEYQRVNLSNQLASRLTGTLYVLDEPTVGLHRRDTDRVAAIMAELADAGNTIVVVEHDRGIIEAADWIVELGPGGGHRGGSVVFAGQADEFRSADTLTARYLRGEVFSSKRRTRRQPAGVLRLAGASGNNLRNLDVEFPLGTLTVVSGVSGSGKSTLVVDTLHQALVRRLRIGVADPLAYRDLSGHEALRSVKLVEQTPIGRTPRSNPATYLKVFDPIRRLFAQQPEARAAGHGPGFFSFNVPGGRCETCKGEGYQKLEMYFFEELYVTCEDCGGRRYGAEALRIKYLGRNIHDVLGLTVEEAVEVFSAQGQVVSRLSLMKDVGLGYLRLGQPATTLSGGEAQRLKLCAELGSGGVSRVLYILDEPTVGLHARDVSALLDVLDRLVEAGNSVLVIEHNLDVIRAADWVLDLGPEGGQNGGRVVAAGTPEQLMRARRSHTGRYLKEEYARPARRGQDIRQGVGC